MSELLLRKVSTAGKRNHVAPRLSLPLEYRAKIGQYVYVHHDVDSGVCTIIPIPKEDLREEYGKGLLIPL